MVLMLAIIQIYQILQIWHNLLTGRLSWYYHGGTYSLDVLHTTMNAKGPNTIKKHKFFVAEGWDTNHPVLGALIGFKRTVELC